MRHLMAIPLTATLLAMSATPAHALAVRWTDGTSVGRATIFDDLKSIKVCDWKRGDPAAGAYLHGSPVHLPAGMSSPARARWGEVYDGVLVWGLGDGAAAHAAQHDVLAAAFRVVRPRRTWSAGDRAGWPEGQRR